MSHQDQDLLSRALHDRVAGIGEGSRVDLDSVRARARGIRRRRNALRGAVAAVVASLAVPGGLAVTTALQDTDGGRPDNIATGTPSPTVAEEHRLEGPTALTLDGLPRGEISQVPLLMAPGNGLLLTPDGPADGAVELDEQLGPLLSAVAVRDGWLVLASEGPRLHRLDAEGQIVATEQYLAGDEIVLAHDRSAVLYVLIDPSDGSQLLTLEPTSGRGEPVNWRLPASARITPVGLADEGTVVFETQDESTGATTIHVAQVGDSPRVLETRWVGASAAGGGVVYGVTLVDEVEPSVCAAALRVATGRLLWENCDYSLPRGSLSPNGGLLLAYPGYVDGLGALSVSVLDASTGRPLVEYGQQDRDGQVTVLDTTWEDDRTFVTSLADGDEQAVVRHGVQGGSELTNGPIGRVPYGEIHFRLMP